MALRRIVFGAAALSAARVFQLASSFIAIPFLARILTPSDFGLVALALSMVVLFTYVGDAGLGRSLVRTSATDIETWSSAHWSVVLLTTCLGLVILALAWPASIFFDEPRLFPILATFALAPVLMGIVEIPASSLLQQEKLNWLAGAEFASALAGIIVALWLAVTGFGAWALVWQQLAQRIVKAIVINSVSKFRPMLVLRLDRLSDHLRFARDTVAWSVMMFIGRQADTLIIGKVMGAATLGLYNVAVRVMQLPINIFGGSVNSAIYPRLVQLHNDPAALRKLVLTISMAQAAFVFPPIAAIAGASEAFFTLLLSDRWAGAGEIFTLLALAAAIQTVIGLNGSLLQAIGRTGARLRLTVEFSVLWAGAALFLAQYGVLAVACGFSAVTLLYLPRLLQLYLHPIGCTLIDYARALAGPTLTAIAIFALHRGVLSIAQIDAWPQIGIAVLETLAGYAVLTWFGRRVIADEIKTLREIFAARGAAPSPSE